ncbi:MAG TPA: fimbrial protein [Providencia sp.]|uniref:fimbrial protein n=1 Tax=Providencia sp. TaxID=589 RepID=UPI000E9265F2|nr:type 1 fimbrial protein [Providencia sp.]MBP6081017.1 fimbrial protein [Providencia sp.]HBO24298.1 fimbrial protein [Providencia sp.]
MNIIRNFALFLLFFPAITYSDVYITLEATLISPACVVTSTNGEKELTVNFSDVNAERIPETKKTFQLVIEKCDVKKGLQMYLSPKDGDTALINGIPVLTTNIDGLGIRFVQEGQVSSLPFYEWKKIIPTTNDSKGFFAIEAQLVTDKKIEDLQGGPFRAAISLMIDYI